MVALLDEANVSVVAVPEYGRLLGTQDHVGVQGAGRVVVTSHHDRRPERWHHAEMVLECRARIDVNAAAARLQRQQLAADRGDRPEDPVRRGWNLRDWCELVRIRALSERGGARQTSRERDREERKPSEMHHDLTAPGCCFAVATRPKRSRCRPASRSTKRS